MKARPRGSRPSASCRLCRRVPCALQQVDIGLVQPDNAQPSAVASTAVRCIRFRSRFRRERNRHQHRPARVRPSWSHIASAMAVATPATAVFEVVNRLPRRSLPAHTALRTGRRTDQSAQSGTLHRRAPGRPTALHTTAAYRHHLAAERTHRARPIPSRSASRCGTGGILRQEEALQCPNDRRDIIQRSMNGGPHCVDRRMLRREPGERRGALPHQHFAPVSGAEAPCTDRRTHRARPWHTPGPAPLPHRRLGGEMTIFCGGPSGVALISTRTPPGSVARTPSAVPPTVRKREARAVSATSPPCDAPRSSPLLPPARTSYPPGAARASGPSAPPAGRAPADALDVGVVPISDPIRAIAPECVARVDRAHLRRWPAHCARSDRLVRIVTSPATSLAPKRLADQAWYVCPEAPERHVHHVDPQEAECVVPDRGR